MRRLLRWASNALAVVLLLLGVAAAVMWARSYRRADTVTVSRLGPEPPGFRFDRYWWRTYPGGFLFERLRHTHPDEDYLRWDHGRNLEEPNAYFASEPKPFERLIWGRTERRMGFGAAGRTWTQGKGNSRASVVIVPYAVLLASACLPAVLLVGRRVARRGRARRLAREGRCASCGYDLRATPGRCPECGRGQSGGGAVSRRSRAGT